MSPMCYILAVLTVVFAVACVLFRRSGKSFEGMICKFMASFGFISVAVVGYCASPHDEWYFFLVLFALMFGFFGDVLLGIKEIAPLFRPRLIPLGTVYFLVSHIFFLAAFIRRGGFEIIPLVIGIAGGILIYFLMPVFKMKVDGKMRILMTVYCALLVYKVAASGYIMLCNPSATNIAAFVGSLLFLVSDTCLSFLYFAPVKRKNVLVTIELSTYYPAQILLAMSVAIV